MNAIKVPPFHQFQREAVNIVVQIRPLRWLTRAHGTVCYVPMKVELYVYLDSNSRLTVYDMAHLNACIAIMRPKLQFLCHVINPTLTTLSFKLYVNRIHVLVQWSTGFVLIANSLVS